MRWLGERLIINEKQVPLWVPLQCTGEGGTQQGPAFRISNTLGAEAATAIHSTRCTAGPGTANTVHSYTTAPGGAVQGFISSVEAEGRGPSGGNRTQNADSPPFT